MKSVWLVARRELAATLRSPLGFIVSALGLAVLGIFYNTRALGGGEKYSTDVLAQFFFDLSGFTILISPLISMRLLAEERQSGTIALLLTSPVKDYQIILGKFLGAFAFLAILLLITIYMPLLVMVHGKVSWGHIFSGYLGVLLLGAACLAIGTFGSSVTKYQVVAVFVSGFLLAVLVLSWKLVKYTDPPLKEIFSYLALHNIHFLPFKGGKVHLRDIVYYLTVTGFFLFAATRMLESRRWR
jgi:ABC-2 type transport system permease protein